MPCAWAGLGRDPNTCKAVTMLIDYIKASGKMAVIDADALYALSKYKRKLNKNFVVTPNMGELALFHKRKIKPNDLSARIDAAVGISKLLDCIVLLKGHDDIITDGKRIKVVKSSSSALAIMGTGDVLAGIIGAYTAQNSDMFIAATAAAYLHATIGDRLHKEKGNRLLAGDVVEYIPKILRKFDRN